MPKAVPMSSPINPEIEKIVKLVDELRSPEYSAILNLASGIRAYVSTILHSGKLDEMRMISPQYWHHFMGLFYQLANADFDTHYANPYDDAMSVLAMFFLINADIPYMGPNREEMKAKLKHTAYRTKNLFWFWKIVEYDGF